MPLFGPPNIDRLRARGDDLGLIKALEYQKGWRVRRDAAEALGQIGDATSVEPLIAALGDDNQSVRRAAIEALGQIGDTRAVEPLMAALKSPAVEVRKSAAEALGQIGDRAALEPLIAALKDASWSVRRAAADALGEIGDQRAIGGLRAALEDHDSNVRRAAADALATLGQQPGGASREVKAEAQRQPPESNEAQGRALRLGRTEVSCPRRFPDATDRMEGGRAEDEVELAPWIATAHPPIHRASNLRPLHIPNDTGTK